MLLLVLVSSRLGLEPLTLALTTGVLLLGTSTGTLVVGNGRIADATKLSCQALINSCVKRL